MSRDQLSVPTGPRRRARPSLTVYVGRRSCWLRGRGAARLADALAVPRLWCPVTRLLTCPAAALDDLLALCEHERVPTVIRSADGWPTAGRHRTTPEE